MTLDPQAIERRLQRVERLARIMDARWRIFGVPVGIDALIGLVPVAGDLISAVIGGWILCEGVRLGAGRGVLIRMGFNLVLDFALGTVPVLGDGADLLFRANQRNAALLRAALAARSNR